MKTFDTCILFFLSAIWGASFLFMRVAAPEFGPLALILMRVSVAALVLSPIILAPGNRSLFRKHLGHFFFLGAINSAMPFCLLAYSTLSLEAGLTSLLNATTPIFTALVGAAWIKVPVTRIQKVGLFIAFAGVGILSWDRLSFKIGGSGWAVVAALAASLGYAVSVHFYKLKLSEVPAKVITAGISCTASLLLLPLGILFWPASNPSGKAWMSAICLGAICTAMALLIFYKLIRRISALAASSVTFLIPIFAVLWGTLFLKEALTLKLVIGMLVILLGTGLSAGFFGRITVLKKTID